MTSVGVFRAVQLPLVSRKITGDFSESFGSTLILVTFVAENINFYNQPFSLINFVVINCQTDY